MDHRAAGRSRRPEGADRGRNLRQRRDAYPPDYIGLITDALIMNPWDREIVREGRFVFHPEYGDALAQQGLQAERQMLVPATEITLAKG